MLVAIPLFFFNDTATTEIYTLSLHDALPILGMCAAASELTSSSVDGACPNVAASTRTAVERSEEHTSELQSQSNLVCRLLLEKKKLPVLDPRMFIRISLHGSTSHRATLHISV